MDRNQETYDKFEMNLLTKKHEKYVTRKQFNHIIKKLTKINKKVDKLIVDVNEFFDDFLQKYDIEEDEEDYQELPKKVKSEHIPDYVG